MPRTFMSKRAFEFCPILERTRPTETVSSAISASSSLSSLTLQTLSCCFHLWHHAQTSLLIGWACCQSLSLSLCVWTEGHHPSIVRFHWFEAWLLTSFPHFLETWASVEHKQRSNKSCLLCFSVLLPVVWLFFLWFVILFLFFYVFLSVIKMFIGVLF